MSGSRAVDPVKPGENDQFEILGHENLKDRGWWTGRAGLAMPALMVAVATYMLIGQFAMKVPESVDLPGPQFFPWIIIVALYVLAAVLAFEIIRNPQLPELAPATEPEDLEERAWYTDWRAAAWAVGGLVLFIALIVPVGWIISAALMFVMVAHAIGSQRWVMDVLVGLFLSSVIYLIFAVLLSVDLPSGLIFAGGR